MTDTKLDSFMENLKQLSYSHINPLINNNILISSQRHQFKWFYKELDSMIQTLFVDEELHELEIARNLKNRFKGAADEAEDIVDMFISSAIFLKDKVSFLHRDVKTAAGDSLIAPLTLRFLRKMESSKHLVEFIDCSLNLEVLKAELKSIKKDMIPKKQKSRIKPLTNNNTTQCLVMKEMMQSPSPQAAGTSTSRHEARQNLSATEHEVIVGFDKDARSIMDRLAGDHKQLDIVSIVGTGGLGKTTLATKVFNYPYVVYYFQVRGWIIVSQTYAKRDLLIGILKSIGKSDCEATSEMKLREMLHKCLKGKRYSIVIDDIWSAKAWQDLRLYLPDDNIGSRVLLTTRLAEVVLHARPGNVGTNFYLICLPPDFST